MWITNYSSCLSKELKNGRGRSSHSIPKSERSREKDLSFSIDAGHGVNGSSPFINLLMPVTNKSQMTG